MYKIQQGFHLKYSSLNLGYSTTTRTNKYIIFIKKPNINQKKLLTLMLISIYIYIFLFKKKYLYYIKTINDGNTN